MSPPINYSTVHEVNGPAIRQVVLRMYLAMLVSWLMLGSTFILLLANPALSPLLYWGLLVAIPLSCFLYCLRQWFFPIGRKPLSQAIILAVPLIGCLFVAAFGTLLAGGSIPKYQANVNHAISSTHESKVDAILQKLALASGNYAFDNGLAELPNISILLKEGKITPPDLRCLRDNLKDLSVNTSESESDFYYVGEGIPVKYAFDSRSVVIISKIKDAGDRRVVGFADGKVRWLDDREVNGVIFESNLFRREIGVVEIVFPTNSN